MQVAGDEKEVHAFFGGGDNRDRIGRQSQADRTDLQAASAQRQLIAAL
jgi:hypothetical protein